MCYAALLYEGKEIEMINKIKRMMIMSVVSFFFAMGVSVQSEAEEMATFRVQSAEIKESDIIRVSVYLNGVSDLGGVEMKMSYDSDKVSYAGSGLGQSFADGIGETHCNENEENIKGVILYSSGKKADGEIMYSLFRLKDGVKSYQPSLEIIGVVDGSKEIRPLKYEVLYQQSDGRWESAPDNSGEKIDGKLLQDTKRKYGAKEDAKDRFEEEIEEKEKTAETRMKDQELNVESKADKRGKVGLKLIAIGGVAAVAAGIFIKRKRRKKFQENPGKHLDNHEK